MSNASPEAGKRCGARRGANSSMWKRRPSRSGVSPLVFRPALDADRIPIRCFAPMDRTVDQLIAHLASRVATGKPVTLSVRSGRTVMNSLMAQAGSQARTWEEDLHFELGIWDDHGRLIEVLARIGNLKVARAAFRAAVVARPDSHVLLKQKAWVLEDSAKLIERDSQAG